jgi:hypothetical protein
MKKILILITMMGMMTYVSAQVGEQVRALGALRQLQLVYQQAKLLSFDVRYTYAKEEAPVEILDSLDGQYRLHGSRYWGLLGNTESVYDDQLLLLLFKEDSLLYLARPKGAGAGPVAMVDSLLLQQPGSRFGYAETASELLVSLVLPETSPYKKMTWHIDRRTGYLNRTSSLVRSDQLYEAAVRSSIPEAAAEYVVVETVYSHYRNGGFPESIFDLDRYLKKEGTEYVAQGAYAGYKVFLGSTGL